MSNSSYFNLNLLTQSPLFLPLHSAVKNFSKLNNWPNIHEYNLLMNSFFTASGKKLRIVEQDNLQKEFNDGYEQRTFLKGELQTRTESWHDFFNLLMWSTFPKTKALINHLQFINLENQFKIGSKQRTSLQNRLTLFDESGMVILSSSQDLIHLLKNFQWNELFWKNRNEVKTKMGFFIFGHALYEKALSPYIGMTGQGLIFLVDDDFFKKPMQEQIYFIDLFMVDNLKKLKEKEKFSPLPVLGIPGWHIENERKSYYENKKYFRNKIKNDP